MKQTFWIYKNNVLHKCSGGAYRALYQSSLICIDCNVEVPFVLAAAFPLTKIDTRGSVMNTYIGKTFRATDQLPEGAIEIHADFLSL